MLRDERGESLVEVLITVAVVSIAVVGIVTGIATAARSSAEHREQASASMVLVNAAEAIDGYTPTSASCATLGPSTYSGALTNVAPAGWTVTIASASCATVAGSSLPHVVVRATPPDGTGPQTLELVRRSVP